MPDSVRELSENSRVQMAEVIAGLINGQPLNVIVETTGVPANRIRRWVTDENDDFFDLLRDVEDSVILHLRDEMVSEVAAAIDRLTPKAVASLEKAIDTGTTSQQVTAAAHVLRFAGYGRIARDGSPGLPVEEMLRGSGADTRPDPTAGD